MAITKDWLPGTREGQLSIAKNWVTCLGSQAGTWNVPAAAALELRTFMLKAQTALDMAKDENTRTPVTPAQCKEAFNALTGFMRDFKRWYFLSPPSRTRITRLFTEGEIIKSTKYTR